MYRYMFQYIRIPVCVPVYIYMYIYMCVYIYIYLFYIVSKVSVKNHSFLLNNVYLYPDPINQPLLTVPEIFPLDPDPTLITYIFYQ
jgi:hypothetical protein